MKDFIFITGKSGIGKSTLAKGLLEYYKTTCIEQWMIPEFYSRDGIEEMTGELEELTCWENQIAIIDLLGNLKNLHKYLTSKRLFIIIIVDCKNKPLRKNYAFGRC